MEIKVGDYVRTEWGIGKVYNINELREPCQKYAIDIPRFDDYIFLGEKDFKSSPNIIDLIEVGDYVNGWRINEINNEKKLLWHLTFYGDDDIVIPEKDIKTIVTHECFERMEYKI